VAGQKKKKKKKGTWPLGGIARTRPGGERRRQLARKNRKASRGGSRSSQAFFQSEVDTRAGGGTEEHRIRKNQGRFQQKRKTPALQGFTTDRKGGGSLQKGLSSNRAPGNAPPWGKRAPNSPSKRNPSSKKARRTASTCAGQNLLKPASPTESWQKGGKRGGKVAPVGRWQEHDRGLPNIMRAVGPVHQRLQGAGAESQNIPCWWGGRRVRRKRDPRQSRARRGKKNADRSGGNTLLKSPRPALPSKNGLGGRMEGKGERVNSERRDGLGGPGVFREMRQGNEKGRGLLKRVPIG